MDKMQSAENKGEGKQSLFDSLKKIDQINKYSQHKKIKYSQYKWKIG